MDKINKIKQYMAGLGWTIEENIGRDGWGNKVGYFIKFSRYDWHGKFAPSLTGHAVYFTGLASNAFDYEEVLNTVHHTAKIARKAWHEYKDKIPYLNTKRQLVDEIMIHPWEEGKDIPKNNMFYRKRISIVPEYRHD